MLQTVLKDFALQKGYSAAEFAAAREAYKRKWRLSHPAGRFDHAGRFYLEERCSCCNGIRTPSRAFPHSEMAHGRSVAHVARLHDVPQLHVRRLIKVLEVAWSRSSGCASSHTAVRVLAEVAPILKPVRPAR